MTLDEMLAEQGPLTLEEIKAALMVLRTCRANQEMSWNALQPTLRVLKPHDYSTFACFHFVARWQETATWLNALIRDLSETEQKMIVARNKAKEGE